MHDSKPFPPLTLYVHLPWCVRKCPYCDFNSHALSGALPARQYMDALLRDLEFALSQAEGREIASVFIGGGTPSLFPAGELERLMDRLRSGGQLSPVAEITLEANPGTVERHSFDELASIGVNRVSLGAQSFDPELLARIGRIHGPDEVRRAALELHAAGIPNFNIDLMYALPGQTRVAAAKDINEALALRPAHVSHYQLTIEPNTAFYRRPPALPDQDAAWDIQSECQGLLQDAGLAQYEVSAFAQPGKECAHNLNYWRYGDYLGIGAGAHEKLTKGSWAINRARRRAHPYRYMREAGKEACIADRTRINEQECVFEFMLNAVRLKAGFTLELFEAHSGLHAASLLPSLHEAANAGMMANEEKKWRTTELGWRFMNDLQAMFLPAGEAA